MVSFRLHFANAEIINRSGFYFFLFFLFLFVFFLPGYPLLIGKVIPIYTVVVFICFVKGISFTSKVFLWPWFQNLMAGLYWFIQSLTFLLLVNKTGTPVIGSSMVFPNWPANTNGPKQFCLDYPAYFRAHGHDTPVYHHSSIFYLLHKSTYFC
jgi:hypothetical protein